MGWILIIFPFFFLPIICCCFILVPNTTDDGENNAIDMELQRSTEELPDMFDDQEHRF
jgi:hypothetical protein